MQRMVIALVAVLGTVACKERKQKHEEAFGDLRVLPPGPRQIGVVMAQPRVRDGAPPARYAAVLPTMTAELADDETYPPRPYVQAQLARGDRDMQARVLASVRAAAASGAVSEDMLRYYDGLVGYTPSDVFCKWLRDTATGGEPAPVRGVFFHALVHCRTAADAKAMLDPAAPAAAVIDWYFEAALGGGGAYDPRLATAAAAVIESGDASTEREIGFVFAQFDSDEALAAFERLRAQAKDRATKATIAVGMLESKSAKGRALGEAACKDPSQAKEPMCDSNSLDDDAAGGTSLGDEIVEGELSPEELVAKYGRDAVLDNALACATSRDRHEADQDRCRRTMAAIDWDHAKQTLPAAGDDSDVDATLRAFASAAERDHRLDELGFTAQHAPGATLIGVQEALFERGRATQFDVETDQYPNEHDGLLAALAALVAPALDHAIFEEVAPGIDSEAAYLLRAYDGGKIYELEAQNNGDWYDLGAVLGLLNAMLAAHGDAQRVVTLPTGDQTAIVLGGPEAGIDALAKAGLIELSDTADSMASGKEFEQRVFEQLGKEETQPADLR